MNTPICDFVREYNERHAVRMHMPGHKGVNVLGAESYDITEIDGADVLYHADGIILESENNARQIFGTARTLYSTEGSSLCIRAMLYLVSMLAAAKGRKARIAAGRNAHKTFIMAAALLDIDVSWIYSDRQGGIVSCVLDAGDIEREIESTHHDAVYITSPDYLGNVADIRAISEVCRRHGCRLIVDNAHGAYLKFMPESTEAASASEIPNASQVDIISDAAADADVSCTDINASCNVNADKQESDHAAVSRHPIDLGADMCCDSAHKTLPVLTGGAYLHISEHAPKLWKDAAEHALSMFASTSPSYLIMQSLDMANKLVSDGYGAKCRKLAERIDRLKAKLKAAGWDLRGDEPLKLCIAAKSCGYHGTELAKLLEDGNIYIEFSDPDYAVMMFTPCSTESDIDKLESALLSIRRREPIREQPPLVSRGRRAMSAKAALMAESESVETGEAVGRVLAEPGVTCPPAVPIAVCGELIDADAAECFRYYGIDTVKVIRK